MKETLEKLNFPVVGVGASAGGLEAFVEFVKALPESLGAAVVFVPHLAATRESDLVSILARVAKLPVGEITADTRPLRGHLHVIPANADVTLADGAFRLQARAGGQALHLPIDAFFASLAHELKHLAIGVILSGTGSDGTLGLRAISSEGGITFVQDVESAKFGDMPRSAGAVAGVDYILPPQAIAAQIVSILRHPLVAAAGPPAADLDDEACLAELLKLVKSATGADFSSYRPTTLRRRIIRRMILQRARSLSDYLKLAQANPPEVKALFQDILIHVTSFFRDPDVFGALKKGVFQPAYANRDPTRPFRAWIPGCATGEEAYSIAISIIEFLRARSLPVNIQIFGTDISPVAIDKARRGLYGSEIEGSVGADRLREFFTPGPGGYQINKYVRDCVVFAVQNVIKDPPFSNLDLICCRNLLIYFTPALQSRVMAMFHHSLNPNGYLVLGSAESTGDRSDLFVCVDKTHKIFSRTISSGHQYADMLVEHYYGKTGGLGQRHLNDAGGDQEGELLKHVDKLLLSRFAPAGFLVNENLRILQFRGDTSPFLSPTPGTSTLNLMDMLKPDLRGELRALFAEAARSGEGVSRDVTLGRDGRRQWYRLDIAPVTGARIEGRYFLITFGDGSAGAARRQESRAFGGLGERWMFLRTPRAPTRLKLEQELEHCREQLRALIEERDSSAEELRSTNEEILSANEELQSSNEELETAREELQSSNEELHTVNDELNTRNEQLAKAHDDLSNLLASSEIPVVMVDRELRIRLITPAVERVFKIISADIGRSLGDINVGIELDESLADLGALVIETAQTVERQVRDREGTWYSLRVVPYRRSNSSVDGAIYAFVDVDRLQTEFRTKTLRFAERIVRTIREPLVVLDGAFVVQMANHSFYEFFRVTEEETIGRRIYDLGNRQWDIPPLRKLLEEIIPLKSTFEGYEVIHNFEHIGPKTMMLNAREIHGEEVETKLILLAFEDCTERKRSTETLRLVFDASPGGLMLVRPSGEIARVNLAAARIFEYPDQELVGKNIDVLLPDGARAGHARLMERFWADPTARQVGEGREIIGRTKGGQEKHLDVWLSRIATDQGDLAVVGLMDISERKRREKVEQERAAAELANQAKTSFLANMSHEIRTPLAAIVGFSDLLIDEAKGNPTAAGYAERIRRSSQHLAALVDDVLDLSKIEADQLEVEKVPTDLQGEITSVFAVLQGKAQEKGVTLSAEVAPDASKPVLTDPTRLRQILINLLGNAIKFTAQGGVTMTVSRATCDRNLPRAVFTITDTGCGVPADMREKIFEPFAQASTATSRVFGGTGLGLTLSRRLARLLGGDVTLAASQVGKGSTFVLTIDGAIAEGDVVPGVSAEVSGRLPVAEKPFQGKRILVVEDGADNQVLLQRLLGVAGAEVQLAANGEEGLAAAKGKAFDAIIMDMNMPVLDGYEATRKMRRLGIRTPVIALTAYATKEERNLCIEAGCDDFRSKPIRAADLYSVVREWCGKEHTVH